MINKKTLVFLSGGLGIILYILNYIGTYKICDFFMNNGHEGICPAILSNGILILFPIIPLFIFSLITYKMRKEVFVAWGTFALVWIPLSMLAILTAPEYGNAFIPIEKGTVAFFSSLLFSLISLTIILWKYFLTKEKRT